MRAGNTNIGSEDFIAALQNLYGRSQVDRAARRELGYLRAYPAILGHFKAIGQFDHASLTTAALMVYGWMPTIPVLNFDKIDEAITAINAVKCEAAPRANKLEIEALMAFVNRSLVGVSKLLHFADPEKYAIYDRRVVEGIKQEMKPTKGIANVDDYLQYLGQLDSLKAHWPSEKHERVQEILGYEISKLRALEMQYFFRNKEN